MPRRSTRPTLDGQSQRGEMRTFEELPDLLDVTRADGDRDDDEALALDADEFDEDAIDPDDAEDDDELDYRAASAEREDDLDGQGPEDSFNEDGHARSDIEGLGVVRDADSVEGGEDDVSNFEAKSVSDEDLDELGYADDGPGRQALGGRETRSRWRGGSPRSSRRRASSPAASRPVGRRQQAQADHIQRLARSFQTWARQQRLAHEAERLVQLPHRLVVEQHFAPQLVQARASPNTCSMIQNSTKAPTPLPRRSPAAR